MDTREGIFEVLAGRCGFTADLSVLESSVSVDALIFVTCQFHVQAASRGWVAPEYRRAGLPPTDRNLLGVV